MKPARCRRMWLVTVSALNSFSDGANSRETVKRCIRTEKFNWQLFFFFFFPHSRAYLHGKILFDNLETFVFTVAVIVGLFLRFVVVVVFSSPPLLQ